MPYLTNVHTRTVQSIIEFAEEYSIRGARVCVSMRVTAFALSSVLSSFSLPLKMFAVSSCMFFHALRAVMALVVGVLPH